MKIVITSQDPKEIKACKDAFAHLGKKLEVVGIKVSSASMHQTSFGGQEMLLSAFSRITKARKSVPDADLYLGVDQTVLPGATQFQHQKAIVAAPAGTDKKMVVYAEPTAFPPLTSEETKRKESFTSAMRTLAQKLVLERPFKVGGDKPPFAL